MENSSNPPNDSGNIQDHVSLYASNTNVSNFVSVKLSGLQNYHLWKKQMLCLMRTHAMYEYDPRNNQAKFKIIKKYDSLVHGWILGSLSDNVLRLIVDLESAQDVWDKLQCYFDPTLSSKRDSSPTKSETKTKGEEKNMVLGESSTNNKDLPSTKVDTKKELEDNVARRDSAININGINLAKPDPQGRTATQVTEGTRDVDRRKETVQQLIKEGYWYGVYKCLENDKNALRDKIKNGNTLFHMAVAAREDHLLNMLLDKIDNEELITLTNSEGSTLLHTAAIIGNTEVAVRLIKKNKNLLHTKDLKGKTPFENACRYMHFKTIESLLDAVQNQENEKKADDDDGIKLRYLPEIQVGVEIVVNAIYAKEYKFAQTLIRLNPQYAVSNDHVLMAMARTFPSRLEYWERLIYPSFDISSKGDQLIVVRTRELLGLTVYILSDLKECLEDIFTSECQHNVCKRVIKQVMRFLCAAIGGIGVWTFFLILLVLSMVYFSFYILYFQLWNAAAASVPAIKNIVQKKMEFDNAKEFLTDVCDRFPDATHDLYRGPILLAACQDAFEVVDEILGRDPEAIKHKDNDGYDIIQLATIHRSERVYNLVHIMIGESRSIYRAMEDSSNNNMLHLAGRLAPSNKLKRRAGAALQLQRELQWRQEVGKLVFPAYVTKQNIFEETPEMVFTKEHSDLVKEGEKWMKTVAESCSITTALITTIMFAAAITVPGGSNDNGYPVFKKEIAYAIFAFADAFSLFSSTTSLLVFLSILTARFAEEDFLISLPRRLIIGLFTLLISTAAMMVAFGATLFLVSTPHKLWVIAPICVFAFPPIAFFIALQLPLIIDLCWSTYRFKFDSSESKRSKFDQDRAFFFVK